MFNPNQSNDTIDAVRLGVARAISEAGLTPSQAESKLASLRSTVRPQVQTQAGIHKRAFGWTDFIDAIKTSTLALVAGGAAVGAYSGHARNEVERKVRGEDDPEMSAIKKKTEGYQQMTDDLKSTLAASAPMPAR